VGFEKFWRERIGEGEHIEFIGAAATLIYREWQKAGMQDQMSYETALLLIAAILDNTLNLTSANTTEEDRKVFRTLCEYAHVSDDFRALYFSEVQKSVELDLKNAIFNDIKTVRNNPILPNKVAQLCVWDADRILSKLPEIRSLFVDFSDNWMINIIDIEKGCSYFVCDDFHCQNKIEDIFSVHFDRSVAKTQTSYLRKEIIKKTLS
jgi:inorganic pyrophosphatase/exopolyphosphatase